MRYVLLVCVSGIVLSGCAAIEDYHYCFVNYRRAASAWSTTHSRVDRHSFSADYKHGWKSGYYDISMGGCGEPPAIPPNKYWSPRYQSEVGQAVIEDWYAGFQDGVTAAQSEGSGAFHAIPTGPTVPSPHAGLHANDFEGSMTLPFEEVTSFLDESQYFLQPFAPVHSWPRLPEAHGETIIGTPEPLPPQNGQSTTTPVDAKPSPAPPASAEVNTVPPVITEE